MVLTAKRLTISGRVQGVWFRGWTVETANGIGLTGWVRNRADGTVEAVVQGTENAVAKFLARVHEGPPSARVDSIEICEEPVSDMRDFEQWATR